ncbi:MAG: DUF5985 family protein [Pseudonocardiaceae bacterium]
MAEAIYILCALTSVGCAVLLFRGYRASRMRLLFWSSLCFGGLALNNVMLFADAVIVPEIDLFGAWRSVVALAGLGVLIFGLVWEAK